MISELIWATIKQSALFVFFICILFINSYTYFFKRILKLETRRFHLMMFVLLQVGYCFGLTSEIY